MKNSFGTLYRLTSFGESHGKALGGVIDGVPAGMPLNLEDVQAEVDRRKPGSSPGGTTRQEPDRVELLSGIFKGRTTGAPIGFVVWNKNYRSEDYAPLQTAFRPSHADYTYHCKYGWRDPNGGGRSSARETLCRVVAGAVAKQLLRHVGISVTAYTTRVGDVQMPHPHALYDAEAVLADPLCCPHPQTSAEMQQLLHRLKAEGNSIGGVVSGTIRGCPPGMGEPLFHKLHAELAGAMMGIPAAKGFQYGIGVDGLPLTGRDQNDALSADAEGEVHFLTNHSGGIQGGISNGQPIYFDVLFKPIASIATPQQTIDAQGQKQVLEIKGRHDACVIPRVVPVVEAMAAMVMLDLYLLQQTTHINP